MQSIHDRIVMMIIIAMAVSFSSFWVAAVLEPHQARLDFRQFTLVQQKKQRFFEYLTPQVLTVNREILRERAALTCGPGAEPSRESQLDAAQIERLAVKYRVPGRDGMTSEERCLSLKARIAIIPVDLVLAQAANESAWGTSRFAREQNNYFGLWCFTADCGVRPLAAAAGTRHQVAQFETVADGLRYYALTLNSHPAYESLRALRTAALRAGAPVTGASVLDGLGSYSERGRDYIDELHQMIRVNRLDQFPKVLALLGAQDRRSRE